MQLLELFRLFGVSDHPLAILIPSEKNIEADKQSRRTNIDTEWKLNQWAYEKIEKTFGRANIDLFASRINSKCDTYCSWHRDSEAVAIDALTIDWNDKRFYAFPPFALIHKVLQKIINDRAVGVVIVPQ